jgi:ketosteroid isomerase-like protein
MPEENVNLFVAATDAFNRLASDIKSFDQGALDQWLGAMHAEVTFEPQQAALQGTYIGQQGAMEWLADLAEHYEGGRIDLEEIREAGDQVLGIGTIHVVGQGSGIEADVPAAILMTFRDGLITRVKDFGADREGALEAAGLSD